MKTYTSSLSLLFVMALLSACRPDSKTSAFQNPTNSNPNMDVHSFARPDEAVIRHLDLDLTVDFDSKSISGTAAYQIGVQPGATQIILDTRDLDIQQVEVDGSEVEFELGPSKPFMGQPLRIPVSETAKQLTIHYATQPTAEALQWLEPSQTAGKNHPYLFTQGQAILTRTWIPIQDSPGIRLTYSAKVKVPSELMAVMSAENPQQRNPTGEYTYQMEQPIPAYLIVLAVGDFEFRSLGPRTGAYTEAVMMDRVASEFSDLEQMVTAAENLYGPYLWDRYDVIVLPPSFPFGGMENPRITFATPTIIAGDKSLIALIAHELAHSWSGNLVTNATWNDFWLNEGFTVYFEWRIMEALYGESYANMLISLGHQGLSNAVEELNERDTHLFLDLKGRNPDDGMTEIAYEKGAHFLKMLELKVGRENFDAFLKKYFADHQFQSMSTEKFISYLNENLIQKHNLDVNINEWIYGPGLPENCPVITAERFEIVDQNYAVFIHGQPASKLKTDEWSTMEWIHFLRALPDTLSDQQMDDLDQTFSFTNSTNSEIQAAWYELAIKQGYGQKIMPSIRAFLIEVGRRKFLTPLYKALIAKGQTDAAREIFEAAKPNYHSISSNSIQQLLENAG